MARQAAQRNSENQKFVTGTGRLQLQFSNKINQLVFTGEPIKGEDGHFLTFALIDSQSGEVVTFGPEASARVEIVVLEADFGGDSWTREKFKSKCITKEGDKPLLTGILVLDLKDGIGCVGSVGFSHSSVWKGICQYRLGAIVTDDDVGTRIKEGFTDSFVVKDRRLTLNEKKYPPNQSDEAWRIKGIAKNGAFYRRLIEEGNIYTVGDLWKSLNSDPKKLRDVLGKGMSARMWEDLVAHVRTCTFDEKPCRVQIQGIHTSVQIPVFLEADSPKSVGPLELIPASDFASHSVDHEKPYDVPLDTEELRNRGKRTLSACYHSLQALGSIALTDGGDFAIPHLSASYQDLQTLGSVALTDDGGFVMPVLSFSYQEMQALGCISPTACGDFMIPVLSASYQDLEALGSAALNDGGGFVIPALSSSIQDPQTFNIVAITNGGHLVTPTSYETQDFQIGAQDFAIPASYTTMDSWSNGGYKSSWDNSPSYPFNFTGFDFQFYEDEHTQLFDQLFSTSLS